jgi:hypothetical protein
MKTTNPTPSCARPISIPPVIPIRRARPLCRQCGCRPAITQFRGEWRVMKDHDVCRQCWRSWMDSIHAWRRAG